MLVVEPADAWAFSISFNLVLRTRDSWLLVDGESVGIILGSRQLPLSYQAGRFRVHPNCIFRQFYLCTRLAVSPWLQIV